MKKLVALLMILVLAVVLVGCGQNNTNDTPSTSEAPKASVSVACIKGPTGLGMLKLMQDDKKDKALNDYTFTVASAPDELTGKIVNGEINIASVPTNLAAKLYKKTEGKLRMLAINTLGTLSIIENGTSINRFSDLKGKTIYSTGEGSNPEYILRYLLTQNGLDPDKDVKIKFIATNDELVATLIKDDTAIAMVPEPAATTVLTKKETLRRALNINSEWEKVSEYPLMMGCVVALDTYIEQNTEAVEKFLEEYSKSIEYVTTNTDKAAEYAEKFGIIASAEIAREAIPNCSITFVAGSTMSEQISGYFGVLQDADETSLGGSLPDEKFYYVK